MKRWLFRVFANPHVGRHTTEGRGLSIDDPFIRMPKGPLQKLRDLHATAATSVI